MIRFLLDDGIVTLDDVDPTETVLELLRYRLRRTGTKEGCAEGDCGACTVLVGELDGDAVRWRAVNACILLVPMLHGKALLTVESLSRDGALHPVQQAMIDLHASQCGFCTPGFVMSLYGRAVGAGGTKGAEVRDVIAGNLCRCTGYGPILAAGEAVAVAARDDAATVAALRELQAGAPARGVHADRFPGTEIRWFMPNTADELADLLVEHPDALLVAGATDVGLWVTKQYRVLNELIFVADVAEMRHLQEDDAGLTVGACVRYSDAAEALARLHPDLAELLRRIGGVQVRNAGTIGGNIANGSPIGDMPPALIALGATLTLRRGPERRTLPLEDFFIAYGTQDRQPGEFVESVFIPRPRPNELVRIAKLSKRFDSDITAVLGAVALTIEDETVTRARVAYGGMAGTPRRASACEAALTGAPWCEATVEEAARALATDYTPLTDLRGSSRYRLTAAANLLRRLWYEQAGSEPGGVLAGELVDG